MRNMLGTYYETYQDHDIKQKKEKAEQQNKLENNDESAVSEENVVTEESTTSVVNSLEEADPWLKQKEESQIKKY